MTPGRPPQLTFALEFGRGECEFLVGDLASAEERLSRWWPRVPRIRPRRLRTCLRLALYTVLRRRRPCGRDRARVTLPRSGSRGRRIQPARRSARNTTRLWRLAWGLVRSSRSLIYRAMSDPVIRRRHGRAQRAARTGVLDGSESEYLLRLRTANLSIQHGNTDASTVRLCLPERCRWARGSATTAGSVSACWPRPRGQERPRLRENPGVPDVGAWVAAVGAAPA